MAGLETVVVVGGSLAGIRSAEALRRKGFEGRLVLIGAESEHPYDRPPLSKQVLRGESGPEKIRLVKPEAFDALELDLRLGMRADALLLDERACRSQPSSRGVRASRWWARASSAPRWRPAVAGSASR